MVVHLHFHLTQRSALCPIAGPKKMKASGAQVVSCCVITNCPKIMQHMHGNLPYMSDYWADPVVHLLLLKNCKSNNKTKRLSLVSRIDSVVNKEVSASPPIACWLTLRACEIIKWALIIETAVTQRQSNQVSLSRD